jgi:S-DNA-T family DNA segregation ATPase FtsK/SpoIIIE
VRDGPGWTAVIDLDFSFTAEQAIKRRQQIASGLDLDENMVWLDRVRGTAGSARRLKLWCADEDPFEQSSGPWPLLRAGTVDVFKPFPFGTDQRGRPVDMSLMFTGLLIGSSPYRQDRGGPLDALACALDPIVEAHLGRQGRPGLAGVREGRHRCGFGARTDVVEALLADLQDLQRRMNRRVTRWPAGHRHLRTPR